MQVKTIAEIGQAVKTARKAQGLTQRDLSLASGVCHRLIIGLENGTRAVRIDNVLKICAMLGLSMEIK